MSILNFCSKCGKKLAKNSESENEEFFCENCGSNYYHNSKPTTGVLIVDENDRVLLTKRSLKVREGMWGMPGGFLKNGEEPETGAIRETKEEIGVDAGIIKFLDFIVEKSPYGENEYLLGLLFQAKIISGVPKAGDETSEVRWFNFDEIPWNNIAFEGNIKALKTYYGK